MLLVAAGLFYTNAANRAQQANQQAQLATSLSCGDTMHGQSESGVCADMDRLYVIICSASLGHSATSTTTRRP